MIIIAQVRLKGVEKSAGWAQIGVDITAFGDTIFAMVERETMKGRQIAGFELSADIERLDRNKNGRWRIRMPMSIKVKLRDGRTVQVDQTVTVTAKQNGRKSR